MITLRLPSALLVAALLVAHVPPARAQEAVSASCTKEIYAGMATEQRIFRAVLYGQKKAEKEEIGNVRYDKEGNPWLKTADGEWRSLAPGYEGTTWSDTQMDLQGAAPVRRGLFERREAVTSDILPEVIQSVRALQCRLKAQCDRARQSVGFTGATLTIKPDGCVPLPYAAFPACAAPLDVAEATISACDEATVAVLEREMRLLELQVSYDAAYRTLLQFAGQMEGFMEDFRLPLLQPLWQAVDALSAFDGVTCFLSQCDE